MNNILGSLVSELLKHPGVIALFAGVVVLKIVSLLLPNKRRRRKYRNGTGQRATLRSQSSKIYAGVDNVPITAKADLMNQSERRLFQMLLDTLPDHYIFPQVSFNALITHPPYVRGWWRHRVRRNFNTKFVDFVVCDKDTFKVIVIIEYDGHGHSDKDDALRDRMLQDANYRIDRFNETDTLATVQERFRWLRSDVGPLFPMAGDFSDESPRFLTSNDDSAW